MSDSVVVVGHPFSPIGTGRAARQVFRALQSVGVRAQLLDTTREGPREADHARALAPHLTTRLGDFNIWVINGDEVDAAVRAVGGLSGQRNVVYPAWELPRYPRGWGDQLKRFDAIWAVSSYTAEAIAATVAEPVLALPLPAASMPLSFYCRHYFGIPDSSYAYLFTFDLRSYATRKNPRAVLECFERLIAERPWAQACLVMKMHGVANSPVDAAWIKARVAPLAGRVVLLDAVLTEDEMHSLVLSCDAFVSLHRAEGFGLGLAEAMWLGRPVIATGYSGNMDFMTPDTTYLVDYSLVDVPEGAYPHGEGQQWADPNSDTALAHMLALLDDPAAGRDKGQAASRQVRARLSYRACGLSYRKALLGIPDRDSATDRGRPQSSHRGSRGRRPAIPSARTSPG